MSTPDVSAFLPALRDRIGQLSPTPTARHCQVSSHVPPLLCQSKFVFVRRDSHRSPFQRVYDGPFKVIASGAKTFKIDFGGRSKSVSIDRLKPAHLDVDRPVPFVFPRSRGRPRKLALSSVPGVPLTAGSGGGDVADTRRPVSALVT